MKNKRPRAAALPARAYTKPSSRKMPAAVLAALRRVELTEVPVPEPGPGEVLIELGAVGICGSDLHYWRHGRIADQVVKYPMRLGHEPAGVIVGLGPGVKGPPEGTPVAVEPGIPCGGCRECLMGRANLCPNVRFLGTPPIEGAFQRYLVMPADNVAPLPEGMDAALGAAAEPVGVALHALDLMGLRPGEHLALIGGGPVGLCIAAVALQLGARVVALAEPRPHRRRVAEQLGVERTTGAAREEFLAAVKAGTDGVGADVVCECAGSEHGLDICVAAAARGGRVAIVGIPEVDLLPVNAHVWRKRELVVINVRRSNRTLERALRLLGQTDLKLRSAGVLSGTVGLGGIQDALADLDREDSQAVKVMVDPRLG